MTTYNAYVYHTYSYHVDFRIILDILNNLQFLARPDMARMLFVTIKKDHSKIVRL